MARMKIRLNQAATGSWLATLSAAFPAAEFSVQTGHCTDDGLFGIVEVTSPNAGAIVQRFNESQTVQSHEVLHSEEQLRLIQYAIPVPESYHAIKSSGTRIRFPYELQDGWLITEITAPHDQLTRFGDELRAADISYQIESLTQSYEPTAMLTDRQQELVTAAVEQGYYESPRKITLNELAEAFDVNSSAASGVLHRAEGRIIESFVT